MKKTLFTVLAASVLALALTGCSSATGGGNTPPVSYIGTKTPGTTLAVGDIVFNDGSATSYSEIAARTTAECTDAEKAAAIAVIFRVGDGAEGNKTLGVGIKLNKRFLAWCKDSNVNGYNVNFADTVVTPEGEAGSLTFTGKTDGSDNFMIMARTLDNQGKNDTGLKSSNNYTLPAKDESTGSDYSTLKTNYPAFEFAYYYGKNGHNITSGSTFENGWYLPSESELNDIYQANKTDNIVENALGVTTGGDNFEGFFYLSSSQFASYNCVAAYNFSLILGVCCTSPKDFENFYVCAVRAFN